LLTLIGEQGHRWEAMVPETRRERMRGLRGCVSVASGQALLLQRCRSVHTFGMRFPIIVVFLDAGYRVRETRRVRPGRVVRPRIGARHVVELPLGASPRPGDRLRPRV
jgi:uncharacterized protein